LKKVYDLAKSVGDAVEKYSTVIDAKLRGAQEVIGRVEKDAARVESATKRVVDAGSEVAATVGKVTSHVKSTYETGRNVVTSARDVGQSVLNLDFFRKFDSNIDSTSLS
jgi:methyl-accepting chemotaxis protein